MSILFLILFSAIVAVGLHKVYMYAQMQNISFAQSFKIHFDKIKTYPLNLKKNDKSSDGE